MKAAGLKLAAAVVEGLPATDRNMSAMQAEAWKLFERQVKVCGWVWGGGVFVGAAAGVLLEDGACVGGKGGGG